MSDNTCIALVLVALLLSMTVCDVSVAWRDVQLEKIRLEKTK